MRKNTTIEALLFDLDGTAIPNDPHGMPSARVMEAVGKAQKLVKVSVATGRELASCKPIIEAFSIEYPCIISGGTQLYDPHTGDIIWQKLLSKEKVEEIIHKCSAFPFNVVAANEVGEFPLREYFPRVTEKSMLYIVNIPVGSEGEIVGILKSISGIAVHVVVAWKPHCVDLHISHEAATKKHAMQELLHRESVDPRHVMVVGDGGNDLPLFSLAGLKIAMGNASPELKAAANEVTQSVDDDGLAVAIEKYILE